MTKSADVIGHDNEVPPAMASFLSSRGAARGRSVKAQVELQEKINQTSKKIQERWTELEKEWRKFEKGRKDSATTYGITGGGGPIVELNVGGTDMDVLRADLVRAEDSVLADMFSGRWEGRLPRDARGRVFLDVSPTCFRKVVGFLVKLGIAKPGKVLDLPTLTPDEQPHFDHLVLVLGLWAHVYEGRAIATPQATVSSQPRVEEPPTPQVDQEEIKKFGKAVATSFAAEELALKKADEQFQLARKRFDQEVAAINAFAGAPAGFGRDGVKDDIVELNIGGTMASTRRSTLCRSSDSALARMFDHSNERRAPPFVRDSKGRYFVQYNDYCFRKIIEVLRMKRWPWPPTASALNLPSGSGESGFSEGPNRFRIHVREDEREDFSSLVSYFFPGCEKFINEVVGRSSSGEAHRSPALRRATPSSPKPSSWRKPSASSSGPVQEKQNPSRPSSHKIKPNLPSEISVLEIRVGRVRHIKPLPRKSTQYLIKVQVHPEKEEDGECRSVLWHSRTPAPPVNTPVTVLCNLPYIKHEGITFTAVILCMDDDLLLPPPDAPIGELVAVKNHPPTPSKNGTAVSIVWEKVLSDELLQVGEDEVPDLVDWLTRR